MLSLEDLWPPYQLRVTSGDLTLTVVRDADLPELVALALSGIHPPDRMPFATPWTDADPSVLPAAMTRYHAGVRATDPADGGVDLQLAVRRDGELLGVQAFTGPRFRLLRTGETGSWLAARFQGAGVGARMRRAVCALAFDHLGAEEVTSGAFLDNPASLAVSAKVGYRPNGVVRVERRGAVALNQRLLLSPDAFVRGEPIEVAGADALRAFVGLDG